MEKQLGKLAPTLETPMLNLRGENLEYYKDIEYLKEMTRQANALLDRSNATYENILDDQKLGYKVRARSLSDSSRSASPELEAKCKKCGLAHGAVNFCIVEQIMKDEKAIDDHRRSKVSRANWSFKSFVSMDSSKKLLPDREQEAESSRGHPQEFTDKMDILEKMTPKQVLDRYEALCFRYGPESGRKFLLANALTRSNEGEIQKWTTPREEHRPKRPDLLGEPETRYQDIIDDCASQPTEPDNILCSDMSKEVVKKMEQLVDVFPPCQTEPLRREKSWKKVFKTERHKEVKKTTEEETPSSEQVSFESTAFSDHCHCDVQTCECKASKICTTPELKKTCHVMDYEEEHDNNYLLIVRRKIYKRRETKRKETQMLLKESVAEVPIARTKSDEYIAACEEEQHKMLKNCLSKNIKGYDEKEFDEKVRIAAEKTAVATTINPRQFERWNEQMKEQEEEDDTDSGDSQIQTDDASSLISHQTLADYNVNRIKPSKIPYADDVYDLIDNLYDKIMKKFETSIRKQEATRISRLIYRPIYANIHAKLNILSHRNALFNEIMFKKRFKVYNKRFTPFRVRRGRKLKRLEALWRKIRRAGRRRDMIRGLQLGKTYRKVSTCRRFTPRERWLVDPKRPNRFAAFNLAGDARGKGITMKRIHQDYKIISSMFDGPEKTQREDLMDEGMKKRLREFQRKLYNNKLPKPPATDSGTEDQMDFTNKRKSTKEEMELLQKANPRPVNFTKSDESMTHQRSRQSFGKCKTSNSEDKLKTLIPIRCIKRRVKPQQSVSNMHVQEETGKDSGGSKQPKVRSKKKSSGNRTLTNLLPPLNERKDLDRQVRTTESKDKKAGKMQSSALTKLPKLNTPTIPKSKTKRRISDESLPSIKQRESVENLKPRQGKASGKALGRKTSFMDVNFSSAGEGKLPFLVGKAKCTENGSLPRLKPTKPRILLPTVPKESGFKAWR